MQSPDPLLLLISPFISLSGLRKFLENGNIDLNIKIIVRWRIEDLRLGIADLEIYNYLQDQHIPLYINNDIHLKLYVFASNIAFSGSGNLTLRGIGYDEKPNIETGVFVHLSQNDWSKLYELIRTSRQVDQELYDEYKRYVESCPKIPAEIAPRPPQLYTKHKSFTISSLPATETPQGLSEFYFEPSSKYSPEEIRRAVHDLVTFSLPNQLNRAEFDKKLADSFRKTPFVIEFLKILRVEKSLRFGAVNDWIHANCEDVPLPYKWEIKENTRIFYNWLEHFFPEITWDRPHYSQVIYWREP
jgi:hypothetical protein